MAVRCQRNLHPLFLIFPFWLANSANPRASMVGGHYHSHKIKKSDKKGYGMNTQYRVECTSFLLLSFYLVSLFHKSFQNTSYLCSSSEMWDKRWHIVSAMIFWYSLFLCFNLYSSNLHYPPPIFPHSSSPLSWMFCVFAAFQRCETKGGISSQHWCRHSTLPEQPNSGDHI